MKLIEIKIGDFYEDCACHPCICVYVNLVEDEIMGISLVDGTFPRICSLIHCGIKVLKFGDAVRSKFSLLRQFQIDEYGGSDPDTLQNVMIDKILRSYPDV